MSGDKQAMCRDKLIEVAKARGKITYRELGEHIGLPPMSSGKYLNAIWEAEHAAGRPDLTVVVVNAGAEYGKYLPNSRNAVFDVKYSEHVRAYEEELRRVYECDWPL